ncbi:sulfonate/nitrate/taurine transporter substrate-binding protein [Gemmiger sp. An120]|uniref:ABC transporter substrate-binding protein n=1 Tax=Gemmiger sp. An120 TaxID=1965549 RepID=UPI000B393A03|nr:MqnA/MqnD/SBP family protein [Gemmiger sp. An120]OUQ43570.1 sulfonate/nitrate/taurine transporter substrate-binding protein [Gemmiger sp. An120]
MKKFLALLLALVLVLSLAACGQVGSGSSVPESSSAAAEPTPAPESESEAEPVEPASYSIAGLKGPTTMGMVKLMDDAEQGLYDNTYTVTMYGAADEIVPLLSKGELDMAAVPANLAATLYQKLEDKVQVAAVNTLGVLYVVTTGNAEVTSVADLAGKTVYSTGKGTTPEYALNYILTQNGLDPAKDLTIEYKSEATEVLSAMQTAGDAVAVLPQPYVTTAQMQVEGLKVALDLTEEWNKVSPDSALVTGVLLARTDVIEANPAAFDQFLADYQASIEWVNANTADAAQLVAKYEIVPKAEVAEKALPACNITWLAGSEMKDKLSGYLQTLYDQDPASVGGAMPDDGFYYGA